MTTQTHPTDPTLAELAATRAGASRVFHRHGLDFCCGGQRSLAEACAARGLDAADVASEIEREEAVSGPAPRWDEAPLERLVDHVLERFHREHRRELPRLVEMARKVEEKHGEKEACPRGLTAHLERMHEAMELHMQREEQVLFPLFLVGNGPMAATPIRVMEQEHQDHAENLARLRELAHGFEAPPEACSTWKALYLGLGELERDLMEHMHLENNVLFPRALRGGSLH